MALVTGKIKNDHAAMLTLFAGSGQKFVWLPPILVLDSVGTTLTSTLQNFTASADA